MLSCVALIWIPPVSRGRSYDCRGQRNSSVSNPSSFLSGSRHALDRPERTVHLVLVQAHVLELAGKVVVVGSHVEMAVAGKVEQERALLARLVGCFRHLERSVNRVGGFGRGEDSFATREQDSRGKDVVLEIRLGADQIVAHE